MAERIYKQDPKTGKFGLASAGPDVSDDELADTRAKAKLGSTAGADLGGKARAAASAPKPKEETDTSKMSPLHRAAHEQKRKRMGSATTDDAAGALSRRMAGGY
jgi:hypothetical protein